MSSEDTIPSIDTEDRFNGWLDDYMSRMRKKGEMKIAKDRPVVDAYLQAIREGLTHLEAAGRIGFNESTLRKILGEYKIKIDKIDGKTMQRIRRKPNKLIARILSDKCNCIGARTVRQELKRGNAQKC